MICLYCNPELTGRQGHGLNHGICKECIVKHALEIFQGVPEKQAIEAAKKIAAKL
jgi:hypothetical protein